MNQGRLIINGDDFGASPEVNNAIILAHKQGILTSCSLMPGGKAFDDAVRIAKENPTLAVGIHVTCVLGNSVLSHSEIPHLVDRNGKFPDGPASAGIRYFFCKAARKELFKEIGAQFAKFSESGLRFSHIDSHCHLHVHPVIFDAVLELGRTYGIHRMRVPEDDFFTALPFLKSPVGKAGYGLIFKVLTHRMKTKLHREGFVFPRRVYGNFLSGALSSTYVLTVLKKLPTGISEIYFHPALPPDSKRQGCNASARSELDILLNPEVLSGRAELAIPLATYFDLDKC